MRLLALLVLIASTTAFAAPASGVFGDWRTPAGSVVRVARCGPNVCLTVVKLSPSASEKTDQKNPDASLRQRGLCGLAIGTGFHQSGPGHLDGGSLYDPMTGRTYRGTIAMDGDALRLHGYIGIALFGRSETWHRVSAVEVCR